ncbi:hypothetical protein AKO1_015147 [Acrasis kona]|uniref:Uncharacterized protein n=1 Tax=Acrasis kona TaxID=1008807 RepID=A0AAW2YRA1_9EUKA
MPQPPLTDNGALNLWLLYLDERFDIIEVMLSKTCDLIGNNKRKRYTGSVISSGLTPLNWPGRKSTFLVLAPPNP